MFAECSYKIRQVVEYYAHSISLSGKKFVKIQNFKNVE